MGRSDIVVITRVSNRALYFDSSFLALLRLNLFFRLFLYAFYTFLNIAFLSDFSDPDVCLKDLESSGSDYSDQEDVVDQMVTNKSLSRKRWTEEENLEFVTVFRNCLVEQRMPNATELNFACKKIPARTRAQLRVKVNNIIKGKQTMPATV